jgi:PAS domain S-box-containing protein
MSDVPGLPSDEASFRWQAFFRRVTDPVFLLGRRNRLLFVNRAWEKLTGLTTAQARGKPCHARLPAGPDLADAVGRALAPPAETLDGRPMAARRVLTGVKGPRRVWDVEFFPLFEAGRVLGVLGKIAEVTGPKSTAPLPLPEKLLALRERVARRQGLERLIGADPAVRRLAEQVRLASQTRVTALLIGEPGTGKTWIARAIHFASGYRERPFLRLDCARLPEAYLAATLFEAGATPGTLYLREPSALPRDLQASLAGWLGESEGLRPRVLAGCSRDPADEVRSGRLLAPLYGLLSTLLIPLPPLRERKADLPDLALALLRDEFPTKTFAPEALERLSAHSWPGNLRELRRVVTGAGARTTEGPVEAADLPAYLRLPSGSATAERCLPLDPILEQVERRLILLALRLADGNKTRAAEFLAVWRPRLLRRIEGLGLEAGSPPMAHPEE